MARQSDANNFPVLAQFGQAEPKKCRNACGVLFQQARQPLVCAGRATLRSATMRNSRLIRAIFLLVFPRSSTATTAAFLVGR